MTEALPVYPDRPAIVPSSGGRVYISVHDQEYFRQRSAWKRQLAEAHPDAGGSAFTFRRLIKQRAAWERSEAQWYAQYGLNPPDGLPTKTFDAFDPELLRLADSRQKDTTKERVAAYVAEHPDASNAEISEALAISKPTVAVALCRLQKAGGPPSATPSRSLLLFQLLYDGRAHTAKDCMRRLGVGHPNQLAREVQFLVGRGFDIIREARPGQALSYRLISAPKVPTP